MGTGLTSVSWLEVVSGCVLSLSGVFFFFFISPSLIKLPLSWPIRLFLLLLFWFSPICHYRGGAQLPARVNPSHIFMNYKYTVQKGPRILNMTKQVVYVILRYWPVEGSISNISNTAGELLYILILQKKKHESLIKLALLSWRITVIGVLWSVSKHPHWIVREKIKHSAW